MSNFGFLRDEWPQIYESAVKAESFVFPDPGTACIHARRTLELAMQWLFKSDPALHPPYQQNLSALVHEPTFVQVAGQPRQAKAHVIIEYGNRAAHASGRVITKENALAAVRELFHFTFWMARTYARSARPADTLEFLPMLLPATSPVPVQTRAKLKELEEQLSTKDAQLEELITGKAALDAELERLRAEVAEAKRRNEQVPDTHNYSEEQTRDEFIDLLLHEAGWPLDQKQDREYEVSGMPSNSGVGFVDYVLWGKDGKPLGLVEAKRTRRSPQAGQQQAKLYSDCMERQFGQRPVIFYTNGYEHWMWDDLQHPPREVSGFYTRDELELLIQRRQTRQPLAGQTINPEIVERYYQTRAIRKVAERIERDRQRKALLVMATGAGKTRTVIALCDMLMRAGWVKHVLFLADRVALVNQAVGAFKKHLPSSSPVNLVTEKNESGRVYISTYPTMMRLIDDKHGDGTRRFGAGYFDLVIVDEAHRSIYQKYGAIFDYFDSYLVGLTATPKDEVDRNTYRLFALENGVPTDEYSLDDAIKDKYLVPPKAVSVPLRFQREGIKYNELSDEEKDQWDALEWDEDGEVPDEVNAAAVNQWLFNKDTVDKVLKHLMEKGQKDASGDRLGKTIIFAKNHDHAEFIVKRFDENYPHYAGHFARVIDFKVTYAQSLIDSFSIAEKVPHIAVSVDMLDTGIDVPEVVNLVFFKLVRSKTKFWQMVGRGTRLSPGLFGPGKDKRFFYIFDFCQNLEFFSQDSERTEGSVAESLSKKLFANRVELIAALDAVQKRRSEAEKDEAESTLRGELADYLRAEVAGMNLENFLVRPNRRAVERFVSTQAWQELSAEDQEQLKSDVAGLPSAVGTDSLEAKQFDLLILRMQLTLLRGEAGFAAMRENLQGIARSLEEQATIPSVAAKLPLIQEIQSPLFWDGVTVLGLEKVRKELRGLIQFIERRKRATVITDFVDQMGEGTLVYLPGTSVGVDTERLREKARVFLRRHESDSAIQKLKFNEPLTADDVSALEAIFLAEGSTAQELEAVKAEEHLGLFVRSLVGLDREAAKNALAQFINGKTLTGNQMEFVNMVVNYLAQRGWIDRGQLYSSPFTDIHPYGLDGVFDDRGTFALLSALDSVRQNAVPS